MLNVGQNQQLNSLVQRKTNMKALLIAWLVCFNGRITINTQHVSIIHL